MIRYEMKDKSRQEAFEKALPGFKEALRSPETMGEMLEFSHWGLSAGWEDDDWSLTINRNQLNEVVAYDPCAWNNYPEVTPPEKVWMRIEMLSQDGGIKTRDVAFYKAGRWCKFPLDNGEVILGRLRFRPWDEEAAK